jgi:enamine deaminase RidA (YjgF/YER057c/UK114 family)
MRNLLDGLEEAGMDLHDAVAANVYLDHLEDYAAMNEVYAQYMGDTPPARTTIQNAASDPAAREPDEKGRYGMREQISLVAVR